MDQQAFEAPSPMAQAPQRSRLPARNKEETTRERKTKDNHKRKIREEQEKTGKNQETTIAEIALPKCCYWAFQFQGQPDSVQSCGVAAEKSRPDKARTFGFFAQIHAHVYSYVYTCMCIYTYIYTLTYVYSVPVRTIIFIIE